MSIKCKGNNCLQQFKPFKALNKEVQHSAPNLDFNSLRSYYTFYSKLIVVE